MQTLFGFPVARLEDDPLLRGVAKYVADLERPGTTHVVFVRSHIAHGRLAGIDVSEALEMPGVVGVFTGADLGLPGIGEFPPLPPGSRAEIFRPCLTTDRVRHVGEAVAAVVAETYAQAVDAAELVVADIEDEPAVVDPLAALEPDAPVLFPELGSNVVREAHLGGDADPLAGADVVVRGRFVNQRLAAVPLEPNGTLAYPDEDGRLVCWVSSQSPFQVLGAVCRALGRDRDRVRVVVPAVGGGFGAKGGVYPEQVIVAALADRLGRPVRHIETRSENLLAMSQGRGAVQDVELGARRDGTLVGMRARMVTEFGAYPWRGAIAFATSRLMANGVYRIPNMELTALGVVTNTPPVGPYRGAGRPEAAAMLERAMDLLAGELEMDPVELRRRNLLRPEDFPYVTPTGASYDSGDYLGALEELVKEAGYDGLRAEQAARRAAGDRVQLGIGVSTFVEVSGTGSEYGSVRIAPDGHVVCVTGASPHGQGHVTTFSQVLADALQVPLDRIEVVHSDTAVVPRGTGTFGSRSGQLGGSAALVAGQAVVERARQLAADALEAAEEDVVLAEGQFAVAGVPSRSLSWADVARHAETDAGRTVLGDEGLFAEEDFDQADGTYPFGAHLAVVEVDTETGRVELRRIVAVDDCGRILNPIIVAGQVHGGLLQGIAQALFEEVSFDELGNPRAPTLIEYGAPTAAEVPSYELGHTVTPTPRNPLGMKGVGEAGTVGATPAIQNAVLDALAPYGVTHVDLPLGPMKVWQALRDAGVPGAAP